MPDRYLPRPLTFLGVESVAGYLLKIYAIRDPLEASFQRDRFAERWNLAAGTLPQPATAEDRPGVGFAVLRQTPRLDYLILCWWDRHNELPTRAFLRDASNWRPAEGGESFCVWDLRVMWWEREAYVGTILAGSASAVESYLAAVVEGYA